MHARVAGQHLLDQRGAGPRQAKDEHRPARVVTGAGQSVEQLRGEVFDQPIDKTAMLDRVILLTLLAEQFQTESIGSRQTLGGLSVLAARILYLRQSEQQGRARSVSQ